MLRWLFGSPEPEEKKPVNRYSTERLRERASELERVDHSWRAKLQCFECLGLENARKHAGFTSEEVMAINQQQREDRAVAREQRKRQLKDPSYLRSRYSQRITEDNSWTAFFRGRDHAREKAGFDREENIALDEWYKETYVNTSFLSGIFGRRSNTKDEKPTVIKKQKDDTLGQRQIARAEKFARQKSQ